MEVARVGGKEYGRIEYKVGRRKIGFKGLKSLCFRDCGGRHVNKEDLLSTPVFYPTCYTHISFILVWNWMCKDSFESSFNVECDDGLR